MTIQEVMKLDKKCRRNHPDFSKDYGKIMQTGLGISFAHDHMGEALIKGLSLADIIADDWVVEREAKTYWLGVTKIQTHMHVREILQAIETPDGLKPTHNTANGEPWIKVLEIIE